MKTILITILALAYIPMIRADGWDLAVTQDLLHASPAKAVWVDYHYQGWGGSVGAWDYRGTTVAGILDYEWAYHGFRFGFGGAYLSRTDDIQGSRWNFSLTGKRNFHPNAGILFRHVSCGASVFGIRCGPNRGYNFLGGFVSF